MSIAIEVTESELSVKLSGASTVLALRSHLSVPLSEEARSEAGRINAARGV
jgi:hypothetical protein